MGQNNQNYTITVKWKIVWYYIKELNHYVFQCTSYGDLYSCKNFISHVC